ncbi:MAG TPA: hypothetical protein HPP56_05140, partial [Nitrospirae bacterium]|nr:hypothetical protein [Nitrospirota bacterium]
MKKVLLVLAVLGIFISQSTVAEAKKVYVKWGATSVRSGLYANTVAMASIVNKAYPGELEVTVVETGGYLENIVRIQKKSIMMGPADAAAGYAAYEGIID